MTKHNTFTVITSCSGQCATGLSIKLHPCRVNDYISKYLVVLTGEMITELV